MKLVAPREERWLCVLRRIFEPTRQEETEGWRTLHNDNFHILSSSRINDRNEKDVTGRACSRHGRDEKCVQHFSGERNEDITWGDTGVDEWILKLISKELGLSLESGFV
jgi:hypothetical protein